MPKARPNRLPRWKDHAGALFTAANADKIPVVFNGVNYADAFEPFDDNPALAPGFGDRKHFGGAFLPRAFDRGSWGRPGFLVRAPRGVAFLTAASYLFQVAYCDTVATAGARLAPYAALADGLRKKVAGSGAGLAYCQGTARATLPAPAFGNPDFPDGWDPAYGVGYGTRRVAAGDVYLPGWAWALSQGWPGDPRKIAGGDLLVFLVAHVDEMADFTVVGAPDVGQLGLLSYHDGLVGYGLRPPDESGVPVLAPDPNVIYPTQPTRKFRAHEARLRGLVARLDGFQAVVIRDRGWLPNLPTGPFYYDTGAGIWDQRAKAEAHVSAHFRNAIGGGAGYAGLSSLGVSLMEVDAVPTVEDLWAIVKDHFGIKSTK